MADSELLYCIDLTKLIKKLIFFLLLSFAITSSYGQRTVTGKVVSKNDNSTLPGINVVEKGTTNGTITDIDGEFKLQTTTDSPILVFSFVGLVTTEVAIKEEDEIKVSIKEDCIKCYFDAQEIYIYLNSGLINNPVGGKVDMSLPSVFGKGTLRGGLTYQTNLKNNYYSSAKIEYNHFVWTCDYELNAGWFYRDIEMQNEFKVFSNSFEIKQRFDRIFNSTVILGYSNLNIQNSENNYFEKSNGLLIGTELWTGSVLKASIIAKAAIHNHFIEWQGHIIRRFGPLNTFIYYYGLDTFHELSLGLGYEFVYRFRKKH